MLDGMTPSEEEDVSDSGGLPKIGRQKKADSDSDFQVEEDSGSDWEDKKSSRAVSLRAVRLSVPLHSLPRPICRTKANM